LRAVNVQVSELDLIRRSVYELETQHGKIRQQYEDDIARLRQDLQLARQGLSSVAPPSAPSGPGLQHSATGPGAGSLPPYGPGDGFYGRGGRDEPRRSREDRDRVMDRERDRDRDERERDRDRRDRDRDREMDRKMKTERIKTDRGG
jgi:glucose repression regulatory protein TUP1